MKIAATAFVPLVVFISPFAMAFETDNFNCRHENLSDVSQSLNAETNRRINDVLTKGSLDFQAMENAQRQQREEIFARWNQERKENASASSSGGLPGGSGTSGAGNKLVFAGQKPKPPAESEKIYKPLVGCDKTELHFALRGALASSWFGSLEDWADSQPFSKCLPKKNIYVDSGGGFFLSAAGINYTINVGGTRIGADKLSHFMTEGADYYEAQMRGQNLNKILKIGEDEENGVYGLASTGIKSYGDLAANYQGYTFWKNTTEGPNPYFKCVNNKWTQARVFDWNDFVNPMMDESVNCSMYANKDFEDGVARNVAELQKSKNATPLTCPLDPAACSRASNYFSDERVRQAVVHPSCLNAPSHSEEPQGGSSAISR